MKHRTLSNPAPMTPARPASSRSGNRTHKTGKASCTRTMNRVIWHDQDLPAHILTAIQADPEQLIAAALRSENGSLKNGDRCTVVRLDDELLQASKHAVTSIDAMAVQSSMQIGDDGSPAHTRATPPTEQSLQQAAAENPTTAAKPTTKRRATKKTSPAKHSIEPKGSNQAPLQRAAEPTTLMVMKRYNQRDRLHTIIHLPLRSRAQWSWINARRLLAAGLLTPQPLACIEERRAGVFTVGSYLITRFVPGTSLRELVESGQASSEDLRDLARQFAGIWQTLGFLRIGHGDMKATNFIVDPKGRLWLVDLDGMRRYRSLLLLRRERRNDLASFMRNWRERPDVAAIFRARLGTG